MKAAALKALMLFGSLFSLLGCQQENSPRFEVCKNKEADGTLSDNCVFAVLSDGTCGEAAVKVKSEKPADEFTCLVEL